jgi:hypothetical protein
MISALHKSKRQELVFEQNITVIFPKNRGKLLLEVILHGEIQKAKEQRKAHPAGRLPRRAAGRHPPASEHALP